MYINKTDGKPFASENAAKACATKKDIQEYEVVVVEGGYSVLVKDACAVKEDVKTQPIDTGCEVDVLAEEDDDEETKAALSVTWKSPKNAFAAIDPHKDKRFSYKWANPNGKKGNRIEELQDQGWQIDRKISKKLSGRYIDGKSSIGSETRIYGHILMRIPQTTADARNKEYHDMANAGLKTEQEKLKREVGDGLHGKMTVTM